MTDSKRTTNQSTHPLKTVSRAQAEDAVRTLLAWIGEDPSREGLVKTPARVVKAYEEYFGGYTQSPQDCLATRFRDKVSNYNDIILVKHIDVHSHCEHHMVSMTGVAHVGYIPNREVVGLSKVARVVDMYAKRLQTQENMTLEIANAMSEALAPQGVMVMMTLTHNCMVKRGVCKRNAKTTTVTKLGLFLEHPDYAAQFFRMLNESPQSISPIQES